MAEQQNLWIEYITLAQPNSKGNIWPNQSCPSFEPRKGSPIGLRQCWYCRCADFHLEEVKPLDVGICCWPQKIMK